MTSFGRGRGWSSLDSKDQVLRRPGGQVGLFYTSGVAKNIIDMIETYDIREDISPQLVQKIMDLMNSSDNKENLKDICDALCKQAIMYDSLATKVAVLFSDNKIALLEDNNKDNIRSRFLRFLQDNYTSKEKFKVGDKKTFVNIILLHAEVYYRMRLSDGSRLKILAEPLIHYLEDMLEDSPEANLYFVLIQILRSGKYLHMSCPELLNDLIFRIRQMLVKENSYNPQDRAVLLLMIELADNNYEINDTRLREFYDSNIANLSFEFPFSQQESSVITETIKIDKQLKDTREIDNSQRILIEEVKNDAHEQSHYSKNPNVPRAIRGSGALDIKKEDNINARLNSMKIASLRQRNSKTFWDHDDRFHKDYE